MSRQALALILALFPAMAWAKAWNGITPGESTKADVVKKFGEPSKKVAQGEKEVLAYVGDRAIKGTSQAQFTLAATGKVESIAVFPATPLDISEIEDNYGKACSVVEKDKGAAATCYTKQLTDDFRTYFWYKKSGMVVFFNEDKKTVHSIIYNTPK